ncbi:GTP cyclohydrolase 1 type 2/Nif3 [Peziza echinospora]|nr:GTP cyclohydrolase 1 type 2/Nif3 [Peziza echinospora]
MAAILRTVVTSVRRLYPEALADRSWDNTGLLLESPPPTTTTWKEGARRKHVVLLTIDLTQAVGREAVERGARAVVAYHPIIFKPLKSLTLSNPQQATLLALIQAGISVYSPHTAVDATPGGVNDWLADGISGGREHEVSRDVLQPVTGVPGFEGAGMGRLVVLKEGVDLRVIVERVKRYLGMTSVMLAQAPRHGTVSGLKDKDGLASESTSNSIRTIALCAGSGGSLFKDVPADLYFTGELSHHEALAAKERGISVITCFHTNTERGYLSKGMKPQLQDVLAEEWEALTLEERDGADGFEVVVSTEDRDPYSIV